MNYDLWAEKLAESVRLKDAAKNPKSTGDVSPQAPFWCFTDIHTPPVEKRTCIILIDNKAPTGIPLIKLGYRFGTEWVYFQTSGYAAMPIGNFKVLCWQELSLENVISQLPYMVP